VLSGSAVFELYDTYGFPVDLTALIAGEHGKTIDQAGFDKELQEQKERSRAAGKIETEDWVELRPDSVEEFVGYDTTTAEVMITRYRKIKAKGKEQYQLVFNLTPFYAEGGGQVGDTGFIEANGHRVLITDTRRENNLIVHFADELPAVSTSVFRAEVDVDRRDATRRNHSATHLMHEALREVLGTHVEQRGSLVNSDYLRFDFSHFSKMTDEQIAEVEERVNARILGNLPLEESRNTPIDKAREAGAMMLFGEKYGDVVRMIRFGSSVELCGGTHVSATGSIGLFKITSESAVAAGVRRIEAITGAVAAGYVQQELNTLRSLREALKQPADVVKAVSDLQLKNQELMKELERYEKAKAGDVKKELQDKITTINGVNFLAEVVEVGAAELKDIAFQLRAERSPFFGVFGSTTEGKATLTCVMSDEVVQSRGLNASTIVRELAVLIQGGGGGQPFFATAGGKRPEGLNEAIQKAASYLS
jgi:alanyl-tRNA synthetase